MGSPHPQELELSAPNVADVALGVLRSERPVLMLEMSSVYALVAPATALGARALDSAKERLPGKTYGSIIGSLVAFHGLALQARLPSGFGESERLALFEGAFVRIGVAPPEVSTPVVRQGSHQGLLFPEGDPQRQLAIALEAGLAELAEPELFGGLRCSAPLCSSANLSGDPAGSITDEARAAEFARERGVKLWLRGASDPSARGSYPIFQLEAEGVTVARDGPGRERIEVRLARRSGDGADR
jgi:tRNA A37 threonylcarbamoyladenosine synthetase subunit TsaC/SUA5/YrdC